jgi:hypothetical protein
MLFHADTETLSASIAFPQIPADLTAVLDRTYIKQWSRQSRWLERNVKSQEAAPGTLFRAHVTFTGRR